MLFIRSYRFISVCKVGVSEIALALLTRISIPPNYSEKCSKMTGKMFKCFPTGNQNGQINIKWITTQTFSTALCTTDLTCCSSRTSNISGSAFPPAASTTLSTNEVNKQNVKLWELLRSNRGRWAQNRSSPQQIDAKLSLFASCSIGSVKWIWWSDTCYFLGQPYKWFRATLDVDRPF